MSGISNLKNLVKQAQTGSIIKPDDVQEKPSVEDVSSISKSDAPVVPAEEEQIKAEPKETGKNSKPNTLNKKGKEEINKKLKSSNSIVERIKAQDKSGIDDPMLHIRLKPEIHQKLMLFGIGADKLTMQALATFAITHLLEHDEMKKLLNNIKNGMV